MASILFWATFFILSTILTAFWLFLFLVEINYRRKRQNWYKLISKNPTICFKCLQKIPKGQAVYRKWVPIWGHTPFHGRWRFYRGYFCKRCDKENCRTKFFVKVYFFIFFGFIFISLLVIALILISKNNK